jgi:aspartate-semialdehyde dehydrogenase
VLYYARGADQSNVLHCSFGDVQLALFSAGGSITKKFAPACEKAGCTVSI